jgi:predicted GTPase
VIVGAGGRDFHVFNTMLRSAPEYEVVAFTAAQIPGIDDRRYPPSLSGPLYPRGIPIVAEAALAQTVRTHDVDEVIVAYSDLAHVDVMHLASRALAAGADVRFAGPKSSMLCSSLPVVAVCAVRTGCGKSPTTRRVASFLAARGYSPVIIRHPMAYGDLERMAVQRFSTIEEIDAADVTIEEREEYEQHVREGFVVYAGVDYGEILLQAEEEGDVIIWDGGNNDLSFIAPDVLITVADALRPGHETTYHPGETNLLLADIVVINKADVADPDDVAAIREATSAVNPTATIVVTASPATLEPGPSLSGRRALVIEDGPTLTHGEMSYGAGTTAARAAGAEIIDPRPTAVGTVAEVYLDHPHVGPVLPAVGYSPAQITDLEETIRRTDCDVVIVGTPFDLGRLLRVDKPLRRVTYETRDVGSPGLDDAIDSHLALWPQLSTTP